MDVALAIDRFERATTVNVTRLNHRWAGLRSFVADRSPVSGFDDRVPGFFWLVGQGGYGIQMAPALARLAAALVLEREVPEDIRAQGIEAKDVSPARSTLRRGR
jgi:D-arginine dehydrogenase